MDGTVCGIKHNGTAYYFYKNLQGDVIAITDETGAVVARYSYDAWGKCKVESDTSGVGIANINPFRYRSYYYDQETGLYYLQSRYYDPEIGRFINADSVETIGFGADNNIYMYCGNSPIVFADTTGFGRFRLLPVGGFGALYKDYKSAVTAWAYKYAPICSKEDVEYGAIIYKLKVSIWLTYYFMGETYRGFEMPSWYTVANGLIAGFATSLTLRTILCYFHIWIPLSRIVTLKPVGFAHTHPAKSPSKENPSDPPDKIMRYVGWSQGLIYFPIAYYGDDKKLRINFKWY